jgi:HAMP domain-containing protein
VTITLLLILFGALLIYAGWTNRNVIELLRGDNTVSK